MRRVDWDKVRSKAQRDAARAQDFKALEATVIDAFEAIDVPNAAIYCFNGRSDVFGVGGEEVSGFVSRFISDRCFFSSPEIASARTMMKPVPWDARVPDAAKAKSSGTLNLWRLLVSYNIRTGTLFPIFGPRNSFFTLCCPRPESDESFLPEISMQLQFTGQVLSSALFDWNNQCSEDDVQLTDREIECLSWTFEGKTSWEVSIILSISERTVNAHITNAMQKLDAHTKISACRRAVAIGLLPV